MKKVRNKKQPSFTLRVYSGGKLLQVIKGKAYAGPAPASAKRLSRKRRKSA